MILPSLSYDSNESLNADGEYDDLKFGDSSNSSSSYSSKLSIIIVIVNHNYILIVITFAIPLISSS